MKSRIKKYISINEYLEAANTSVRSNLEKFFITKISDLGLSTKLEMTAVQKDFYQINFITRGDIGTYRISLQEYEQSKRQLYFISPEHIYSWKRNHDLDGFLIYFKEDLFNFNYISLADEFSNLFNPASANTLVVNLEEAKFVESALLSLRRIYDSEHVLKTKVIGFALLSFLYYLKGLHLKLASADKVYASKSLVSRYKNLIKNFFLKEKKVSFYAKLLNVSPNHLNAVCKRQVGETAKELLEKQILNEAKIQLQYSDNSMKEIAHYLGFSEPTNFTRFFKKHTGYAPRDYQRINH